MSQKLKFYPMVAQKSAKQNNKAPTHKKLVNSVVGNYINCFPLLLLLETLTKKETTALAKGFVCKRLQGKNEMLVERLNDVKTVKEFCNLGNTLNARGGFEMTALA